MIYDITTEDNEAAQLRTMVLTLALHLRLVVLFVGDAEVRRTSQELAEAAIEYLKSPRQ